ncbi:MAG: 1,6-anhydro-N-acetylmuramyl-L-alanine amidase AmpD [Chromatiaceae bacterium]|nr:1,6-anhydro-N-acetylmuramyl-L-alanine amidase AmpD [Gammaproteobacteria bacterium]MCP5301272.1 1,6-anhydro-N-acetylmuramyl-L-alanine amidase AmpD [Chromatiaceae bacterium]MCP5421962.1 1,6-anhydro-N-acetylmuramyl-L-alanine amidase AmpD [Chromatiaceae bacterium]
MKGPGRIWLDGVRHLPSPNADERPPGTAVDLLVIHNISLPPGHFGDGQVQAFFTNRLDPLAHPYFASIADLTVSAHLLIERDGTTTQFVALDRRAWHAGQSTFCGRDRCNDFSIGIELEGTDDLPFSDIQYDRLADLTLRIRTLFPSIGDDSIVGHSDVAPGRKTDPGPHFDWDRLHTMLAAGGSRATPRG